MTVDHIVPRSKDGGNELQNLQLLCQPCNNLKTDDSHEDLLLRLDAQNPTYPPCCQCRSIDTRRWVAGTVEDVRVTPRIPRSLRSRPFRETK